MPLGYSKIFAAVQSIISLLVFTVLVSKIVSQRQEMALEQIHRLTFEEFLHNLREGFFIIRKDCDRLLLRLKEGEKVTEKEWLDTEAAFRQGQTHLDEIPGFFANEAGLYAIDPTREDLLYEAIDRTNQRFTLLIDQLDGAGQLSSAPVSWKRQMDAFLREADIAVLEWSRRTPRSEMRSKLEEMLPSIREIRGRMGVE